MSEKNVLQQDKYDCGIAALKTIFLHYGKSIKIDSFNNNCCLTAYDLIKISKSNGLKAKGVKSDLSHITENYLPCISHVFKNNSYYHYIVLLKNNRKTNTLTIFDPSEGERKITYNDFEKITTNVFIIFQKKKFREKKDKRFFHIILFLFIKNKLYIFYSVILSLFLIFLSLIFSSYSKVIFMFEEYFINISIIFLLLSLLKNIFLFLKNKLIIKINEQIDNEINSNLISHLFKLPYNYYHKKSTGYLITSINDIENFKNLIVKIFVMLFIDLICTIVIIFGLSFINIYYFFLLFALVIIKLTLSKLYSFKYNNNYLNFKQCKINSTSKFINILENIMSVKNLFLEEKLSKNLIDNEKKLLIEKENFNKINNVYLFINLLLEDLWFILIIILSFLFKIESFSSENLIIFISIYQLFLTFLNNICNFIVMQKTYISSIKNIIDILEEVEETVEFKNKINNCSEIIIKKIEYKNVSKLFNNKILFKDISFVINKNDFVFIEGKSGTGKTTLMKLLLRKDNKFNGIISINNVDKTELKYDLIKNNIVYVSNKEDLFIDTVYNNLKIVNQNEKEINKTISVCELEDMIYNKKGNYIIDSNLSSGEKSRILIARALLTNAKIIIFDECFNEIDFITERRILKKIKKDYDITIIFISHRNNNIDLFNKHYKLENKKIKIIKEE